MSTLPCTQQLGRESCDRWTLADLRAELPSGYDSIGNFWVGVIREKSCVATTYNTTNFGLSVGSNRTPSLPFQHLSRRWR
jgi:hypothetical protein